MCNSLRLEYLRHGIVPDLFPLHVFTVLLVPPPPSAFISNSCHQESKAATFLGHGTGLSVYHSAEVNNVKYLIIHLKIDLYFEVCSPRAIWGDCSGAFCINIFKILRLSLSQQGSWEKRHSYSLNIS